LIETEMRRACSADGCDYVSWNNPIPVVAAIVELDRQIVLARNAAWPGGLFSMITGFLDAQEHPEQALVREVKEELGLQVTGHRFLGHYLYPAANQILMAYVVTATGKLQISAELANVKLVSRSEFAVYDFGPLFVAAKVAKEWVQSWSSSEGA
jgi:NADH pyrophosphatase NudC (nudix superfamily)